MTPVKQNYAIGNQKMLAIVMSCFHCHHYLEGARHLVEVLTDHQNLQRFMTTKILTGLQAHWWKMLSGYNLNIVYKINSADTPSCQTDYTKVLNGCCDATIRTKRCSATFCLQQLYASAV
jgi:hypothetical protein